MILLTGIPSEPPLALVIEAAEENNIPYILFNQRESINTEICLDSAECGGGILRLQETDYPLKSIDGIYVRLMDHLHLPENKQGRRDMSTSAEFEKISILHELLLEWMEVTECRIMNRSSDMGSNLSKPYQAQFITKAGFKTPITLISNDPDTVRQFQKKYKRIIYKSISSIRSIVRELDAVKLMRLDKLKNLPTQFQAYVPGVNIRVHVAGDALFATEIVSDAVDYRYAERDDESVDMRELELPQEIQDSCFKLSHDLALPLCGIDLKRTPDGVYYCFEVNPSPGYSYYQKNTGQNIAAAIVKYLAFGKTTKN